jgi:HAD superfamily hydrolase (TIGR01509 family)
MYDIVVSDLASTHPIFTGALDYQGVPSHPLKMRAEQYLVLTDSPDTAEEASSRGMGALLITEAVGCKSVLQRLRWYDDPVQEEHALFIFDLGGVVVENITMLGKIARRFGLDRSQFFTDYFHYEFPLMEGFISSAQYWQRCSEHFDIEVLDDPFATAFHPTLNLAIVHLIERLKERGRRVVCGSNTFESHWRVLRAMGVLDLFDEVYASHLMGVTKPKHRFYQMILEAEGVEAEHAYFIDDREDNIAAARAHGLSALLYRDVQAVDRKSRVSSTFASIL